VTEAKELLPAIRKGIDAVRSGAVCVIDARVIPGYDTDLKAPSPSDRR